MKKIAPVLFLIIACADLFAVGLQWRAAEMVVKPLIVPSVILIYLADGPIRSRLLITALALCWAGDLFLLADDQLIYGLASFLFAHLVFIVVYMQHRDKSLGNGLDRIRKMRMAVPVLLAGTGLAAMLYPAAGDLRIPVMAYAAALTAMVLTAIGRFARTSTASFWRVTCGAVLFMASDSILAINKFLQPVSVAPVLIMSTYCGALYFIAAGLSRHNQYSYE